MLIRTTLTFFVSLIAIVDSFAAEGIAKTSFYVISEGLPVAGAELSIDGRSVAHSNEDGAIHLSMNSGKKEFQLFASGVASESFITHLLPDEQILLIWSRPGSAEEFSLEVESSHRDGDISTTDTSDFSNTSGDIGWIKGEITSVESGASVAGARIYLAGVRGSYKSDAYGQFEVAVPTGIHNLSVVHADFSSQTLRELVVEKDGKLSLQIELTPAAVELSELIITAPALEGGISAVVDEQKNSSAVAEIIGAAQLAKSGDSDAAGALKRVTGLTVVDGKFVYIRGLGERYSSVTMNNTALPSPDPTRRVVPLDLFPTGIIESVLVQKTYSPDMPGEFAGGTIQLRTKGIPDEKVRKVTLSSGGNSRSTGKTGKTYDGGQWDFLGIDDGDRAMPTTLAELTDDGRLQTTILSDEEVERAGESLANNYAIQDKRLPWDRGMKAVLADRFEPLHRNWGWGYFFGFNYSDKWRYRNENQVSYRMDIVEGLVGASTRQREKTGREIDLGGMLNLTAEIGDNDIIQSNTLLSRKAEDEVSIDQLYLADNDIEARKTTLSWQERQLISQQFTGNHRLISLFDLKLDWRLTYSLANRYVPDTRSYSYQKDSNGIYAFERGGDSNQRSFEDLSDTTSNFGFDLTLPTVNLFNRPLQLKTGYDLTAKTRDSSFVTFRFNTDWSNNTLDKDLVYEQNPELILTPDNIHASGFTLFNYTAPTDNYTAKRDVSAFYLMGDMELSQKLTLMTGARYESIYQEVVTFELANPDEKTVGVVESSDLLPALSLTYRSSDAMQWRFAYSQTLNRPDFKEVSQAPYDDPESGVTVRGNPSLEQASITNLDLRWEWYVTKFENLSVAAFHKNFTNPIERTILPAANETHTFDNALSAVNYGLETQSRFWLSRLFGKKLSRFYFENNLAWIRSQVEIDEEGSIQTNTSRALQGQSPWVVNLTLGYENLIKHINAALLFNKAGKRISSVGIDGLPDAYEHPTSQLDLVFSQRYFNEQPNKLKASLKIKNILDAEHKITRGGKLEQSYRKGTSISFSLQYKWQ